MNKLKISDLIKDPDNLNLPGKINFNCYKVREILEQAKKQQQAILRQKYIDPEIWNKVVNL